MMPQSESTAVIAHIILSLAATLVLSVVFSALAD
jgi:hypothetical protein